MPGTPPRGLADVAAASAALSDIAGPGHTRPGTAPVLSVSRMAGWTALMVALGAR